MVGMPGFEPGTWGLTIHFKNSLLYVHLSTHIILPALPIELHPVVFGGVDGI